MKSTYNINRFKDFKKVFDRVWHETLWATRSKYKINVRIIQGIENAKSFVQLAVLETGSELLLGFDKAVYSPKLSLIYS